MRSPIPGLLGRFLLFAAAGFAVGATTTAQSLDIEKAVKDYKKNIVRKPFRYHTRGRMALARTRDVDALRILIKDYQRPRAESALQGLDAEFARYTMGWMFGTYFDGWLWDKEFAQLRAKHQGPGDIWMWVNTLANDEREGGAAAAVKVALESDNVFLRAAAIEALAMRDRREVLGVIPTICAAFPKPKKAGERRLLVGALSSAILANKGWLTEEDGQKAIRAYIGLLAKDVKLSHSAKMVVARYLAKTIGKDRRYIEPEPWLRLLDQNFIPPKRKAHTVTQVRFFGIEAEGDRICYLVDMSNSMLKKIDPALTKRGPKTGPKRRKRKGQLPDENDIPWHLVTTRFDLAREHLKISMRRLTRDKRFCVVWFGDKSGLFRSTRGMIKATRANVKKVIKELDSIRPGPPPRSRGLDKQDYPDGWLKGQTNMHGGLRRAFSMRAKDFAKKNGYVDLEALAEGCDTIFLISDGAPTSDDFRIEDKDYGDGTVVKELEQKRKVPRPPTIHYHGPMDEHQWLRRDLLRMNAFRKVPIHCVGIGEADIGLLRGIAGDSDGGVYLFGAKAKAAGKKR